MALRMTTLVRVGALAAALLGGAASAAGQTTEQRLRLLEATLQDLLQRDADKDAVIERLNTEVKALRAGSRTTPEGKDADDGHGHGSAHGHGAAPKGAADGGHAQGAGGHDHAKGATPDLYSIETAGGTLRLKSVGVTTAIAAGYASPDTRAAIENLQGGGHDPKQNGFTV